MYHDYVIIMWREKETSAVFPCSCENCCVLIQRRILSSGTTGNSYEKLSSNWPHRGRRWLTNSYCHCLEVTKDQNSLLRGGKLKHKRNFVKLLMRELQ